MDEAAAIALQTRMADLCGHLNVLHAQLVYAHPTGEHFDTRWLNFKCTSHHGLNLPVGQALET